MLKWVPHLFLVLLCLCIIGCQQPCPLRKGSITRLFPTGELLSLVDCTPDEFDMLRQKSPDEIVESFYRINAAGLSQPGIVIPPDRSWSADITVSSPGTLVFSALAVTGHPGPVTLQVMVDQDGSGETGRMCNLKGRAIAHVKWQDFELDVPSVSAGPARISFERIFENRMQEENPAWVCIGAPMFIPAHRETDYPSVVLFVPDTLRVDYLGCYGMPDPVSPVLDNLTRYSDCFTSAYGSSSWTRPAVNSIFTGLYPHKNKVLGAPFSEFLCDYGLVTDDMARLGFLTLGVSSNDLISPVSEYDRGFDRFDSRPCSHALTNSTKQIYRSVTTCLPDPDRTPFFLYVHCMDPHDRYTAPAPYKNIYMTDKTGYELRETVRLGYATVTINDVNDNKTPPVTQDETDFLIAQYKGEIRYMDRIAGDIIRELLVRYPDEKFIFIFLADHGEAFMEHGTLSHGFDLTQETIRVPWILSRLDPHGTPRLLARNVSQVDVFSTLMGLLNQVPSVPVDGIDLYAAGAAAERTLFSFLKNKRDPLPFMRAAIRGERKMLYVDGSPVVQYHLEIDPGEKHPEAVAEQSADPLYAELNMLIQDEQTSAGDYEDPEKVVDKLKALGYIQ
jgi:arylsulfatase A-like enzyme